MSHVTEFLRSHWPILTKECSQIRVYPGLETVETLETLKTLETVETVETVETLETLETV